MHGTGVWMALAVAAAASGCMPLVMPINYHSIHGSVGKPIAAARLPCESPTLLKAAKIDEGELPPGLELDPDGSIVGTPREAGDWHVMLRSARLHCGDKVYPDQWRTLHFEISDDSSSKSDR